MGAPCKWRYRRGHRRGHEEVDPFPPFGSSRIHLFSLQTSRNDGSCMDNGETDLCSFKAKAERMVERSHVHGEAIGRAFSVCTCVGESERVSDSSLVRRRRGRPLTRPPTVQLTEHSEGKKRKETMRQTMGPRHTWRTKGRNNSPCSSPLSPLPSPLLPRTPIPRLLEAPPSHSHNGRVPNSFRM